MLDGVDEVDDPLLPGNAADEEDERLVSANTIAIKNGGVMCWSVLVEINAVVNDSDLLVWNAVEFLDVFSH